MNKWVRLAAKLYPFNWRQRYGAEFDALLDDTPSGWRDVADVFRGAMMMQMSMWSYRNMTVACGLAGLILAAGLAFRIPNRYESHALVHMNWEAVDEKNSDTQLNGADSWSGKVKQIVDVAFSRGSLASIVQRPDLKLYQSDLARMPLEDVIARMKREDIRIDVVNTNAAGRNFVVSFAYPDPVIAQTTTRALIGKLVDANQVLARNAVDRKTSVSLDLLDPASLPLKPTSPDRLQIVFIGLGVGVLAGILAAAFRRKPAVIR